MKFEFWNKIIGQMIHSVSILIHSIVSISIETFIRSNQTKRFLITLTELTDNVIIKLKTAKTSIHA